MGNEFVFQPFWESQYGSEKHADWRDVLRASNEMLEKALTKKENAARILSFLFDRLYVLRNQIMHGGATCGGYLNRPQVMAGASILGFLVPIFIDIMMGNHNEDWGKPYYPPVAKQPSG